MLTLLTVILAVLAAAINAVSSVLQRIANRREATSQDTGLASLTHLLRQPVWLLGILAVVISFGLQAAALSIGELSEVQPLLALELPITLFLAARVFRHPLTRREWMAIAAMAVGMGVFLFALRPTGGHPGEVGTLGWLLGTGLAGLVVGGLALIGWLLGSARGAALFGIAAGIGFALTAVFISSALTAGFGWAILTHWQLYLVPVAGIAAMVLLQLGLQAGTLVAVQPGVTLVDPVVAIVLGVTIFAEQVRGGGWIALELVGACAVGWGTFVLSRSDVAAAGGGSDQDPTADASDELANHSKPEG